MAHGRAFDAAVATKANLADANAELKAEIAALKADLMQGLAGLKSDFKIFKFVFAPAVILLLLKIAFFS